jgi:hypothetical protein
MIPEPSCRLRACVGGHCAPCVGVVASGDDDTRSRASSALTVSDDGVNQT